MIQGISVKLIHLVETEEKDGFGVPVYEKQEVIVNNVLVAPVSVDDIIDATNLYGKKAVYNIAIPKGDSHKWEDALVEFFGTTWHVFTTAQEGIESMIPLHWNKKYMVERYE